MFILQWYLTEKCNWNCSHCYCQPSKDELTFSEVESVFFKCIDLISSLALQRKDIVFCIGGGEPFIYDDFYRFLELYKKYNQYYISYLMTNGSFITEESVNALVFSGIKFVQLSLDGLKVTNDAIRGAGSFDCIVNAIKLLKKKNIIVSISFTVHKKNFNDIKELAFYMKVLGVRFFGIRRYVPLGNGQKFLVNMLSPDETLNFFLLKRQLKNILDDKDSFTITYSCEDGLFAPEIGDDQLGCDVVHRRRLIIMPNGDIYPCRRLPIILGNILTDNLVEVFNYSEILDKIRNGEKASMLCRNCSFFSVCRGGAKCLSMAYYGDVFKPDPQCWRVG